MSPAVTPEEFQLAWDLAWHEDLLARSAQSNAQTDLRTESLVDLSRHHTMWVAVGMLRARFGLSTEGAIGLLVAAAHRTDTRIWDLSDNLVRTSVFPDEPAAPSI